MKRKPSRSQIVRSVAVVALLVLLVVLLTRGDDDSGGALDEPRIVDTAQLSEAAADVDHPVYWLGRRTDTEYELEEASTGKIQIRYLDKGSGAGEVGSGSALAIVTYPVDDGAAAIEQAVDEREGAELGRTKDGALLLVDPNSSNNAHLAYSGDDVHIEVFSPVPGEALRLAVDGEVEPVP